MKTGSDFLKKSSVYFLNAILLLAILGGCDLEHNRLKTECDCRKKLSELSFYFFNYDSTEIDSVYVHEHRVNGETTEHLILPVREGPEKYVGTLTDSIELSSRLYFSFGHDSIHLIDSLKMGLVPMPNMFDTEATGNTCILLKYYLDGKLVQNAAVVMYK